MDAYKKIEKARLDARALWVKACNYDGIPTDAKFVAFSQRNPFDKPYCKAIMKWEMLMMKAGRRGI
jgi:hypothetical protein